MNAMTISELLGTSTAITAALRSGLFAALLDGPASAGALAEKAKTDPRATRLVLDVLATTELVERDGDVYRASALLTDGAANAPLGLEGLGRVWGHAEELLRTGKPATVMHDAQEREQTYRNVVDALAKMMAGHAATLAAAIDRAPARILDIGCGAGAWSLAIAQRFPEAHVTGLDLPEVVRRFEARAKALGLESRTRALGADVHETNAIEPRSFDLTIVANVLRIEGEERARAIVARAANATARQAIVIDALAEGTPARERARAIYTLHLALRSRDGNVYSRERIDAWFREHGLRRIRVVDFDESAPNAALIYERE